MAMLINMAMLMKNRAKTGPFLEGVMVSAQQLRELEELGQEWETATAEAEAQVTLLQVQTAAAAAHVQKTLARCDEIAQRHAALRAALQAELAQVQPV